MQKYILFSASLSAGSSHRFVSRLGEWAYMSIDSMYL